MSHEKPRVEPRTKVLIRANIRDSGPVRDVCILDVSTRGILATTASPPRRGEFIELTVGRHNLVGHVKWAGERRFGMTLHERISVAGLVSGDNGSIALKNSQAARRRNGSLIEALVANLRNMGQVVQLAIMVVVFAAAAGLLASYASDGMRSFQDARLAMSGKRAD